MDLSDPDLVARVLSNPPANTTVLPDSVANTVRALGLNVGKGIGDLVKFPQQYQGAFNPQTPGQWSEEDQFRTDKAKEAETPWGAQMGLGMVGTPGVPGGALGSSAKGIRAYHGSPHDFDRFDISKIGTGEGAQSYGHGLYFAQNPQVAEEYKRSLALSGADIPERIAASQVSAFGRNEAAAKLQEQLNKYPNAQGAHERSSFERALQLLQSDWQPPKGRMYEVNINARPEQFLDWDKPLAQQGASVKDVLAQMPTLKNRLDPEDKLIGGQHIYSEFANKFGGERGLAGGSYTVPFTNEAAASAALRDAGVPGIKYLDQGSRTSGTDAGRMAEGMIQKYGSREAALSEAQQRLKDASMGSLRYWDGIVNELSKPTTNNYVLFRDDIIDLIKKYGIAGFPAAGAAAVPNTDQQ